MRTPGHDFELAVGFLLSEGILAGQDEIRSVRYCDLPEEQAQQYNVVTVATTQAMPPERSVRTTTITSSCGICGTASFDQLQQRCEPLNPDPRIQATVLTGLPEKLRERQRLFDKTGGLHAAGLFDISSGDLVTIREDIGRHNAVDKLVGWAALQRRLPLSSVALVVSGRVSFEIVQKAAIAGIPILAAVSAPSNLAVQTARDLGMTLAAFVRETRATVYACPQRILWAGVAGGETEGDERSTSPHTPGQSDLVETTLQSNAT
jgi:FdhD protein